ncbi:RNA polymerase recycling motor HelD [Natranaerofaba carboxydovora]|uniref:RNA polymerase recycling motor HelD n=1 Tax=Natranaerofaba carboxydovora TaxID=2742683 RepID=UPI001F14472F|nr:RNA polymerase recycling motor HelD [Natranaerofaba carboxydovora]UMZ75144.1 DNA helicase IV [Natranaerofaba carboxydovora]
MSIKKHPDYKEELQYLENIKQFIDNYIDTVTKKQEDSKSDIKEAFEILDFLDSSQSYITILVNARYLDHSKEMIDKILQTKDKPYFSRIDFRDGRDDKLTKYYIGKVSLFNENNEPLIIDWRSPIASLYYDGRIGDVAYEANEGEVTGQLSLKRQYSIEKGELIDFFDVDIATNDELLQASLRDKADNKLKDIVSTIQAEQNKIIRADLSKPLVVQGAAGSGKTTIALHRIAYLIYTYEKSFDPDNFMIIAPNKLFLDYISDVLPELDVENARQTTFTNFCFDLLNIKNNLTVKRQDESLSMILEDKDKSENQKEMFTWTLAFKGSMAFKKLIDNYINEIEKDLLPKEDILIGDHTLMTKDELKQSFLYEYDYLPVHKRLDQIKKKLSSRAKQNKEIIIDKISNEYEGKINSARKRVHITEDGTEIGKDKVVNLIDKRDEKISQVQNDVKKVSGNFTKQFKKKDALTHYKKLVKDPELIIKYSPEDIGEEKARFLADNSTKMFKNKELELEDLAPLIYLKARLEGFKETVKCSNVVIDEAQDYNLFEFYVLRHILNTDNFTLLGDLAQGIYSYRGICSWQDVNKEIFSGEATELTLQQSYRTTIEIMNLANTVLVNGISDQSILAKPVVRHGDNPDVTEFANKDQLAFKAKEKIVSLQNKNYSSIAIIGKTLEECEKIKELLEQLGLTETTLLTGLEEEYNAGVVIVPAYAAKGLEFDGALIVNLDETFTCSELDTKLLYVAMTRAIHTLFVYYMKDTIAHLKDKNLNRVAIQ